MYTKLPCYTYSSLLSKKPHCHIDFTSSLATLLYPSSPLLSAEHWCLSTALTYMQCSSLVNGSVKQEVGGVVPLFYVAAPLQHCMASTVHGIYIHVFVRSYMYTCTKQLTCMKRCTFNRVFYRNGSTSSYVSHFRSKNSLAVCIHVLLGARDTFNLYL